ncbi:MAG: hypothetical protein LBQ54_11185 [Planctomycetaceae bacterium]|jgi:hypothetical protein|nr:hypothetical protein [Planctomycetaceae bacterium]
MLRKILFQIILLILVLTGLNGCHKPLPERPQGMPALYPCTVSVTFGGRPISGVQVVLVPEEKDSRWRPTGLTDSRGIAVLSSSYGYAGAPEGKYTATFSLIREPEEGASRGASSLSLIPLKYSPGKSQEKIEIVSKGKNDITLSLDGGEEYRK